MRPVRFAAVCALALSAMLAGAQPARIASDFELAQMEKQLATTRGFEAQLSGRLNLGDLRTLRNERALARAEYERALTLAEQERRDARQESDLARYAMATSYAGLAAAKLGRAERASALLEEALRYASEDPETWNLLSSAMRILGKPAKAVGTARIAVAVVAPEKKLDTAVYRHALAMALLDAGEDGEAESLLLALVTSLRSADFETLRREAAKQEAFEVYSSARGDVAAYVSLLNRAQLRLAALYEKRAALADARTQYERVLAARSDDVTALHALARLASSNRERDRLYAEAFEANPFSTQLVAQYRAYLRQNPQAEPGTDLQRALLQLERGESAAARKALDALMLRFPANETLRALRQEVEAPQAATLPAENPAAGELRALLDAMERLTPTQRMELDARTFTSEVTLDGTEGDTFESGSISGVPFRFSQPATFAGTFVPRSRLTYRILGVTRLQDRDALLLEPVRLERLP